MNRSRTARSTASLIARLSCGALILAVAAACAGGDRPPSDTAGAPQASAPPAGGAPQAGGGAAGGAGAQLYQRCVTCHQANGEGVPGAFPPLAGSEYATAANVAVPILIVTNGMQGPVTVKGQTFAGLMPQYGTGIAMSDQEVADVLTYVRQSFGNSASAVTVDDVARVKAMQRTGSGPVTAEELQPLMQ